MTAYAFLLLPAMNRVYAGAAAQLSAGELGVFNEKLLDGRVQDIREERIGGVRYIRFSADQLEERDVRVLSNLSSLYALFEVEGGLLRPITAQPLDRFDDDLITIPKYQGKTNEHFTKLLMNVTIASIQFAGGSMFDRKLSVLDPLCGRGTTLNQALMYGWDSAGIDIDARDIEAYEQFLATYLKRKRIKHALQGSAKRFTVDIGATKEEYKAGQTIRVTAIRAGTTTAPEHFRAGTFDAIVTDLPYGVLHGSRTAQQDLARRPLELLAAALPGWIRVLKPGGAIGIAWNRHVAGREKVVDAFSVNGLEVLQSEPYLSFRHIVDQSITRDVLVARKPSAP